MMKSVVVSFLVVGSAGLLLSSFTLANDNTVVYPPLPNFNNGQPSSGQFNPSTGAAQTQFPPLQQTGQATTPPMVQQQQPRIPQMNSAQAPQWPNPNGSQGVPRQYQYPPPQNAYRYPQSQQAMQSASPYAYPYRQQQQQPYNYPAYGNAYNPYAQQAYRGSAYTYPQPQNGYYGYGAPAPVYGYNNQQAYRRPMPPPEPMPRRYWPDFYTDFTADAWDLMLMGPHDMGVMPGGWQFPSVSMPEPVGVTDAVASQLPIIAEEAPDMFEFSAPTFDFFN